MSTSNSRRRKMTTDSYIRDMGPSLQRKLAAKLDIGNMWERLALEIPRRPEMIFELSSDDVDFEPRYSTAQLAAFTKRGEQRGGSSTKSLLTEWGTMNSKVQHLLLALKRANLIDAAHLIQQSLSVPEENSDAGSRSNMETASSPSGCFQYEHNHPTVLVRNYEGGGHIPVETNLRPVDAFREVQIPYASGVNEVTGSEHMSHISGGNKAASVEAAPPKSPEAIGASADWKYPNMPDFSQLQKIDYNILKKITNNFDRRHYKEGGRLIGEGGFGDVYLGTFHSEHKVAIKHLKQSSDDKLEQFKTEVETLSVYKHENLVLLLGYSIQEDVHCLVYQYMANGSLEERLACRFNTPPLSVPMRLEIVRGTARGISFLNDRGLIHRDIKSANILLDTHFNPKVGDFATARVVPASTMDKTFELHTAKVIGTASYLAPEVMSFQITAKLDSFSFGVVLLEVLTGQPVIDDNREHKDLKVHVQEYCYVDEEGDDDDDDPDEEDDTGTIFDLLDKSAGLWDETVVTELYSLSNRCLLTDYKKRPKVSDVLPNLESLVVSELDLNHDSLSITA